MICSMLTAQKKRVFMALFISMSFGCQPIGEEATNKNLNNMNMNQFNPLAEEDFINILTQTKTNQNWIKISEAINAKIKFDRFLISKDRVIGTGVSTGNHVNTLTLGGTSIQGTKRDIGIGIVVVVDLDRNKNIQNVNVHYSQSALLSQLGIRPNENVVLRRINETLPTSTVETHNREYAVMIRQFYDSFASNDEVLKEKIISRDLVVLSHATGSFSEGIEGHKAFAEQFYENFDVQDVTLSEISAFDKLVFVNGALTLMVKKTLSPIMTEGMIINLSLHDIFEIEGKLITRTEFMHNPVFDDL